MSFFSELQNSNHSDCPSCSQLNYLGNTYKFTLEEQKEIRPCRTTEQDEAAEDGAREDRC